MAEIKPTVETTNRKTRKATWSNGVANDTFAAVGMGEFPNKTVQIIGTEDTAASGLQGSNDGGTTWVALTSDGSTAITGPGLHYIWENTELVRPTPTGGGASGTDLSYIITASAILG